MPDILIDSYNKQSTAMNLSENQRKSNVSIQSSNREPSMIVGLVGHVAHGKSTLVQALTGVRTAKFKKELQRNSTIKLGYADAKIYQCCSGNCPRPTCYKSFATTPEVSDKKQQPRCDGCQQGQMEIVRHISFVDCPGHDSLMSTTLKGSSVMDAAILMVAANEKFPQSQTSEHLVALEMMGVKQVIILQNKIDLVMDRDVLIEQQLAIKSYMAGTVAENAPIIPVSAQYGLNIDMVMDYLVNRIELPERNLQGPPRMTIIRSFDVNKPGSDPLTMKGGVIGGSLQKGILRVGDRVEIRPGRVSRDSVGNPVAFQPIFTSIKSISNGLQHSVPGSLVGIGTTLDPKLCQQDGLTSHVLGKPESLPKVFDKVEISAKMLKRLQGNDSNQRVENITRHETLLINCESQFSTGKVISSGKNTFKLSLLQPICIEFGQSVAVSRRIGSSWRLIACGHITKGHDLPVF